MSVMLWRGFVPTSASCGKKVEAMERSKHPMKLILEELIPDMSDRDAVPTDENTQTNVEEKSADENEKFETTLTMIEEVLEGENVVDNCFEFRELMNDLETVKMKRYDSVAQRQPCNEFRRPGHLQI